MLSNDLIKELGLSDYMGFSDKCNSSYTDSVNGWFNECSSVTTLPILPGDIVCHLSSSCSGFSCCVHSDILKRSLMTSIHLDTCRYTLLVSLEDLTYQFQMLNFNWGKPQDVKLHGVFVLRFTIYNIPSQNKFSVDAEIKICFDAKDHTCMKEYSVLKNVNMQYEACGNGTTTPIGGLTFDFWKPSSCTIYTGNFQNGCSSVPSPVSSLPGCRLTSDCQGIECCFEMDFISGKRHLETGIQITQCDVMELNLERKTWTKSGLDSLTGSAVSEKVNDVFDVMITVHESSTELYKITVSVKICYLHDISCQTLIMAEEVSLVRPSCTSGRRRKKKSAVDLNPADLKSGLRTLLERDASSDQIKEFMLNVKEYETDKILNNLQPVTLSVKDTDTGLRSTVKALGSNNPSTLSAVWSSTKGAELEGEKTIISMLTSTTDIVGRAEQTFIVGKGLSNAGVELLGQKLANMTIADIKAMLDLKNLDPVVVAELMGQIKDLCKALLSEFFQKVLGSPSSLFKSEDFIIKGEIPFPRQDVQLFYYISPPIPVGPLMLFLELGAGAYYGMKFEVGAKILEFKGFEIGRAHV